MRRHRLQSVTHTFLAAWVHLIVYALLVVLRPGHVRAIGLVIVREIQDASLLKMSGFVLIGLLGQKRLVGGEVFVGDLALVLLFFGEGVKQLFLREGVEQLLDFVDFVFLLFVERWIYFFSLVLPIISNAFFLNFTDDLVGQYGR